MSNTTLTQPIVTVACPIRNRAAYLPHYLSAILKQTFPKKLTNLIFILNNSTDDSEKILYNFQNKYKDEYNKINIYTYNNINAPEDIRDPMHRAKVYPMLANLRNIISDKTKTEWLFSVDSDIMLLPDTLEKLLTQAQQNDYKMLSALICNGHVYADTLNKQAQFAVDKVKPTFYSNIMWHDANNNLIHVPKRYWNGILEVHMTGAVCLYHRDVFKKARFKDHPMGEDIPFSEDVLKLGYKIYCDCDIQLPHCMNLDLLDKYIKGEFAF